MTAICYVGRQICGVRIMLSYSHGEACGWPACLLIYIHGAWCGGYSPARILCRAARALCFPMLYCFLPWRTNITCGSARGYGPDHVSVCGRASCVTEGCDTSLYCRGAGHSSMFLTDCCRAL